jgi:hypothetical protein
MAERIITLPGIWGSGADTVIPVPPVPGVPYRKVTLSESEIALAQAYANVFDSAKWNQTLYLICALLKSIEQQGILVYSRLTQYPVGALCLGEDNSIYQCLVGNGPSNIHTPSEVVYWRPLISSAPVYLAAPQLIGTLVNSTTERTIDITSIIPSNRNTGFFKLRVYGAISSSGTMGLNFGTLSGVPTTAATMFLKDRADSTHSDDFFFTLSMAASKVLRYKALNAIGGSPAMTVYLLGYA